MKAKIFAELRTTFFQRKLIWFLYPRGLKFLPKVAPAEIVDHQVNDIFALDEEQPRGEKRFRQFHLANLLLSAELAK
jgi:hypothetical protein